MPASTLDSSGTQRETETELLEPAVALERHEDAWRGFAEQRSNAFIAPEWFRCWQRHFGGPSHARVAVVRERGGALLGLMPFAVGRRGAPRTLRIAGGANHSDWLHPVAAEPDDALVARAAIAAADGDGPSWGAAVLDNVDAEAGWTRTLTDARGRPLRRRERSSSVLPYAPLSGLTYEEYLASRSSSFRKQLRRYDRRLERQAEIELRQTETPDRLDADMRTMLRLHFSRWAERGGSSLESPAARAFHFDFARMALERGWLRLLILEADGEPIAAFYGWRLGGRYAFYQAGFDPEWAKLSVGLVLHGRVIERAIAEGAAEYDMLLGSEAYKFRFCEAARQVQTAILTRSMRPVGALIGAELAARNAVDALPHDLRARAREQLSSAVHRLPTGRHRH